MTNSPDTTSMFTSKKLDWLVGVSIDPSLRSHDFEVAFVIAQHVSAKNGRAVIADETVTNYTLTTIRHVWRSRQKLKSAGWLDWRNTRTANVYTLRFDRVDDMLDLRTMYREKRDARRIERLPTRRVTTQASQQNEPAMTQVSQQAVTQVSAQDMTQVSDIHLRCTTFASSPSKQQAIQTEVVERGGIAKRAPQGAVASEAAPVPLRASDELLAVIRGRRWTG